MAPRLADSRVDLWLPTTVLTICPAPAPPPRRTWRRWLHQALCGLSGHALYQRTEPTRVMMRCVACGHETPGWDIGPAAYRRVFDGDASRHRLRPTSPPRR